MSSPTGPYRYQSDPPVTGAVAYLRIHYLDALEDGDTVTSWGTASATSSPTYKNDSTYDFPYVQLNGGYFTLGQQTIQPSLGFTFMGHVLTTTVGPQYPLLYSYAEGQNDGIRIYRTGGSGQDLVFRSQKAASIEVRADDTATTNTWQVFTSRVTDNGDSTLTMEIFVDNVLQGTTTGSSSDMSGIVSGLLEVGQSTAWGGNPVSPIYLTDFYFYDRALSDTELTEMHTYFTTLGDPYTPTGTTDSGSGDETGGETTESFFVEDGVVMYVNANVEESYTPGSSVMNDLSGSSVVFDMKPGIPTSLNDGGLDFSAGTNYLKLSQALQFQTISLWYKKGISPAGKFIELRDTNGGGETVANINQSTIQGDFFLNGSIYVNGVLTSGTDYINLPDDAWYNVVFVGSYLSAPNRMTLFANLNLDFPYKLIFGSVILYNRVLTEAEITQNYNTIQSNPESGLGDPLPVILTYKGDPPVTDAIASLRVRDLDSLENDDAVTTWGTSTASSGPIYKNDSTFPYVDINGGVVDLGNFDIVSSAGFTYTGLVYTTAVNQLYPPIFTYMTSRDDGLRLMRSGSGADLYFYSDGSQRVQAGPYTSSDINTWQVFSVRATNNGDNTVTMDMFIDNVIVATNTVTTSVFCDNTTGHLDVGKSSWYSNDPAAPIYISDTFFYDRALSDPEMSDMYAYLSTLGEYIPAPATTDTVDVGVSDLDVVPKVFFANLSWTPRNLARSYKVEYTGTDGSSGTLISSDTSIRVGSLTPNTEYEFVLYSSDGGSFRVYGESVTSTTQENLLVNYDATDFENSSGIVDLTSLSTAELDFIGEHMNEVFSTGDEVVQSISNGSLDTIFVSRGDTINIADDKTNVFSVPFDESAGSGQQVSISTGTQDIVVSYDETTDQIIVDGTAYSDGESFVVDGKKMKVYNV